MQTSFSATSTAITPTGAPSTGSASFSTTAIIIIVVIGGCALLTITVMAAVLMNRRRRRGYKAELTHSAAANKSPTVMTNPSL